ncbi:unnamed protein product, partial [Prorocentrum cordatum]
AARKRAPRLGPFVDRLLGKPARNAFDTADGSVARVERATGVPQGCPLSAFLFAALSRRCRGGLQAELRRLGLGTKIVAYAGDIYAAGLVTHLAASRGALAPRLAAAAAGQDLPVLGSTLYRRDREGAFASGFGPSEQAPHRAATLVRDAAATLKQAQEKGLCCQVAGAILRRVTVGAPVHLLRSCLWSAGALAHCDQAVAEAREGLIGVSPTPLQRRLGNLPLRDGGAAFGPATPRAAAASFASLDAAFPALAADLRKARAELMTLSPLWRHGYRKLDFKQEPPSHLQRELAGAVLFVARADLLSQLPEEVHRGRLRQGGGPGAGSFLCAPQRGVRAMADGARRMALRERLLCTAVGGGAVGRYNDVRDIPLRFAAKYVDPGAVKERGLQSLCAGMLEDAHGGEVPGDVLDVVFNRDGRRIALGIATAGAHLDLARARAAASHDGAAAAREERRRHAGLNATPCAPEIGGRAGESALVAVRAPVVMAGGDAGARAIAAALWQVISIALESVVAWR